MSKIIIFGNSGSGKSTLAHKLATQQGLAHLDLDTIAWQDSQPPQRMPLATSEKLLNSFIAANDHWVVEGCYADLLSLLTDEAQQMIFLNLTTSQCVRNARKRPWEPHKYKSKQAQDANLEMLIDWIKAYDKRTDTFSKVAHQKLFSQFPKTKIMYETNEHKS